MPIRRSRALTGTALSGARRRPPLAILNPVQPAENRRTPEQNGTAAARYASGQESQCLRDQSDPAFDQKRPPGGVQRWPRSGLAGDFRHLAVVRQSSRATMGVSRLMVKCSELWDIVAFPAA